MSTLIEVKKILAQTLQLGPAIDTMTLETRLLGALPELDSMAVVTILTALEENFGFGVDDDEISADTFATLGSLTICRPQAAKLNPIPLTRDWKRSLSRRTSGSYSRCYIERLDRRWGQCSICIHLQKK